ncbi:hypothetical protein [Ornithinibacillus scapharcae]|uniref:hypothetical protein n=1 Tax=Ornithinibacillus scapharcae TaxID=1147159 RepID=UPI001300C550|nr:hypothetical protein [Ornithinibacillus scapharcae]
MQRLAVNYYEEGLLEKEGINIEPGYSYKDYLTHFIDMNQEDMNQINSVYDISKYISVNESSSEY